ncbi:MAG: hypothetical protein PUH04_03420, partial [Firmicutes bacterium]|nr:hypothetical protein [Bacillota bacterium]
IFVSAFLVSNMKFLNVGRLPSRPAAPWVPDALGIPLGTLIPERVNNGIMERMILNMYFPMQL